MKRGRINDMLSDMTRFDKKRDRRDSGYSTASEAEGSPPSPQKVHDDELGLPSGNSEDSAPLLIEMYHDQEVQELFCRPSSASTLLSDSVQRDSYSISNSSPLSAAGATNLFEESLLDDIFGNQPMNPSVDDFNTHNSWSHKDRSFHFESEGLGFSQSSFAVAANFPGLFTDPLFIDGTNDVSVVPVAFPVIPSPNNADCSENSSDTVSSCNLVTKSNPFAKGINPEIQDRQRLSKTIFPESAEVTNLDVKPTIYCKLNTNNFEEELSKFLQKAHATEKFKLTYEKRSKTVSLIDMTHQDLRDLVNRHGSVCLSKITFDTTRSKKFASIEKKNKRSLASCQSVPRGLALADKFEEIQGMALDSKTKNNRFTNYQRKDRNTGAKLEKEFLENNGLSKFASYSDIERQCKTTLAIFDSEGYLKYLSPKFCKKTVFFFEEEDDIFFVKNLKGFCRVE